MGKGDRKTRKGKIYSGSYGNVRRQGDVQTVKPVAAPVAAKKAPVKKVAAKKA